MIKICRICGCTEDNCSQCIDAQGAPCYWVENDLCSRCAPVCENCGTNKEEDEVRESIIWWTAWGRNAFDFNWEKIEGSKWLCSKCEEELWVRCDCEALIEEDHYGAGLPEDYEGDPLCPECAAKRFPVCEECGNPALSINQGLCEQCFDEKYGDNE